MSSAKEYPSDKIRNVVVLGHGGSGKTSLIDSICFSTGSIKRHGSVKDGTAVTMFTEEELHTEFRFRPRQPMPTGMVPKSICWTHRDISTSLPRQLRRRGLPMAL